MQAGLKHPSIVDLKDVVVEDDAQSRKKRYRMIMELMTGGELFAHVGE